MTVSGQVVLVGGAMRSGTTVFHRCLCTARNANPYISESWFLHDLMRTYRWNLDRFEVRHADQLGSVENYQALIRQAFDGYLGLVSERYGDPAVLFLKHPELTRHFPEIRALFPTMKFIVVVRDPRDVIASMRSSSDRVKGANVQTAMSGLNSIEDFCRHYESYYAHTYRNLATMKPMMQTVRYEDMIGNPVAAFAPLGAFTGAEFDLANVGAVDEHAASAINFDRDKRAADTAGGAFFSELYSKPLSRERIGRFAESLSPADIAEIEKRLAWFGRTFRYWQA
jgi:protein-tyrosine sulfotransferase